MKDDISHRIEKISIELFDNNNSDFARAIGVAESNIRSYLKGTIPKMDVAARIATHTAISCEWLLTGEGEMLKNTSTDLLSKSETICQRDPRDIELLAANKDTIETQKDLITSLKQRIKDLERGGSRSFQSAPSADLL